MFIPQEIRTSFNTANPCHNMKIISSAFLGLANVWLFNPIKIWGEEEKMGDGVNTGYVPYAQLDWNVVNGADASFWSSVYIWFHIWFSITAGISLILKILGVCVGLLRKTLMRDLVKLLIYFIRYSSWDNFG